MNPGNPGAMNQARKFQLLSLFPALTIRADTNVALRAHYLDVGRIGPKGRLKIAHDEVLGSAQHTNGVPNGTIEK